MTACARSGTSSPNSSRSSTATMSDSEASTPSCGKGGDKLSVAEVVESLGFGPAQGLTLLLGTGGVNFCDGVELMLGNIVVMSISADFRLGGNERALLSTVTLLGLMTGTGCSGYLGDTFGRSRPTVWCYAATAGLGLLCALAPNLVVLLLLRLLLGVGMGFGLPPSGALMSETTPERWRIATRMGAAFTFSLGFLFVALVAAWDDADYTDLNWRRLLVAAALPTAGFWVAAGLCLRESPVWLAAVGRHREAREAFREMARSNGRPELNVAYDEAATEQESGRSRGAAGRTSLRAQLGLVFSRKLRFATCVILWASFSINLVSYGDSYAAPQVLAKTSDMAPAWSMVVKACVSLVWTLLAGLLGQLLSRRSMLLLAALSCASVCFSFAIAGPVPVPRPPLMSLLYRYGASCGGIGAALGYVVVFQVAVEIYPTAASATGGALIMGGGRLAAVAAPSLFELTRRLTGGLWAPFYHLLGLSSLLAAALLCCLGEIRPYRPGEEEEGFEGRPGKMVSKEDGRVPLKAHARDYGGTSRE